MSSAPTSTDPSSLEVPQWLKTLPLAPEYHPTLAEFEDPIGYILKIEKEASRYGICKIVPPLPGPPRKTALLNLNRSFAARNSAADGGSKKAPSTFTTRQQQLGFCPRRPRPVQKPVWQSGENYTLQQFENKAKQFEKVQLKRHGRKGNCSFSELEVETLFWRAAVDKPIVVEYANDMPGSGFAPMRLAGTRKLREEDSANVGDTAWNMRGVSRAKGSLLKFMEEIPGVTSPMVYVAMMYSWFAWHVEDHELHSLNYLHMGAGKTWYGVPRDAALAFEEVIRTQGYGGDVNPLVTFMILVEKTTVMSPEVLVGAGIPCCRLVQNAGDFVVTFPGAYHCGFSHGFNCGEAANISTPEWLSVAKEAAVRRASINYPPMLSHFQLLYELALSLWCRKPMNSVNEPRSSRLKDKMKGEGEVMIKKFFVENVIQNNDLLYSLVDMGSLCVVLPRNKFDVAFNFNSRMRSQMKIKAKPALGLSGQEEALEATSDMLSDDHMTDRNSVSDDVSPFSREQSPVPEHHQKTFTSFKGGKSGQADQDSDIDSMNVENGSANKHKVDMLLDQGLLSCVTCGILSFACVAIVRPTDAAAMHLMSSDCSSFSGPSVALESVSGTENDRYLKNMEPTESGTMKKNDCHGFNDKLLHSSSDRLYTADQHNNQVSKPTVQSGGSALDLLASVYGNDSDLEDEGPTLCANESVTEQPSSESLPEHPQQLHDPTSSQSPQDLQALGSESLSGDVWMSRHPSSKPVCDNNSADECGVSDTRVKECQQVLKFYSRKHTKNNNKPVAEDVKLNGDGAEPLGGSGKSSKSSVSERTFKDSYKSCWDLDTREDCQGSKEERSEYRRGRSPSPPNSICDSGTKISNHGHPTTQYKNKFRSRDESACVPSIQRPDKDSSRMHVFCLEHALDVQKQLLPVGGVNMMLLCHPDYEAIESQAKSMADELAIDYTWKDIHFREATEEDQELIQSALADEEAVPVNSDWAVKMGINLYYSVTLSKSPLYSKQLPYNAVIYKAFGRTSTGESPGKQKVYERKRGRKKKLVVSGRWCGKVWMSNQVHPYMAYKDDSEEEELEEADYQQLEVDSENEQLTGNESSDVAPEPVKKSTGKRKKSSRESSAKKPKHVRREAKRILQEEEEFSDDSIGECLRALKSERRKYPSTPELRHYDKAVRSARVLDDDSEEGPSSRPRKPIKSKVTDTQKSLSEKQVPKKAKKAPGRSSITKAEIEEYVCDMEGCTMSFSTKHDLVLHKRNICPVKGCGKKFFSHKYLVQHRKVHMDDRPLKCPWKGCNMSFKWAWARTEHIRVHTGDRPYICTAGGCGQTFRFVSDFSRHKRKTGHVSKKGYR